MAKIYRYRLESPPQARADSSGLIAFELYVEESRNDGSSWDIPDFGNIYKFVAVPHNVIADALAGSGKATAIKNALKTYRNYSLTPESPPFAQDWDQVSLEIASDAYDVFMANKETIDDDAESTASDLRDWVTAIQPSGYPIEFGL